VGASPLLAALQAPAASEGWSQGPTAGAHVPESALTPRCLLFLHQRRATTRSTAQPRQL